MRWLFHIAHRDAVHFDDTDRYAPDSLAREGFIHCSYRDAVTESARLYFPEGVILVVLAIDPRLLDVSVDVAATPRGPMPHVCGPIPRAAIHVVEDVAAHPDEV